MKLGRKKWGLLGLALSGFLALSGVGALNDAQAEEPAPKQGKEIVADFDTMYNTLEYFRTQNLVKTSEPSYPTGTMMPIQPPETFWSGHYGLDFDSNWIGDKHDDWTGGQYVSFYIENTETTVQKILFVLQFYDGETNEQFCPLLETQIWLDDVTNQPLECVLGHADKNSVEGSAEICIPASFKGYVKVPLADAADWASYYGGVSGSIPFDLSNIRGIQVWKTTEGTLYMDTFVVSYDADFATPYTAETVGFGRKTETGKTIVVDYDTMYSVNLIKEKLVDTTESCFPAGKMMTVMTRSESFWGGDYGTFVGDPNAFAGTDHNDWSSAKYLMFYLDNSSESAENVGVAIQTHSGTGTDQQWKQEAGAKAILDDLSGTPVTRTIETPGSGTASAFSVPAGFKGYVKVGLDNPWEWATMWGGNPAVTFDMKRICSVSVWGDNPGVMFMDTFIVSYDDDMETPLTAEVVKCGRVYPVLTEINEYIASLNYEEADYTPASWAVYREKLTAAEAVVENENASQADVDDALAALKEAVKNLIEKTDFTALQRKYDELKDTAAGNYTEASYAAFQAKLAAAKIVLDNAEASQALVDTALSELVGAYNALELKVDKSALQEKYDAYKDVAAGNYTEASYAVFLEKLTAAKTVLDDTNATQPQINAALLALSSAYEALAENTGGDSESDNSGNSGIGGDSGSGETKVKSGCFSSLSGISVLSGVAVLTIILAIRRKRRA